MSPLLIIEALLRRWKLVLGVPFAIVVIVVILTMLGEKRYAASSRFSPQQPERSAGSFAGLAAQFGLPLDAGGSGSAESVQFYAELVRSRDLLEQLAISEFKLERDQVDGRREGSLIELLDVPGTSEDEKLQNAGAILRSATNAIVDPRSNLVTVTTVAPSRELAVLMNRRLLELVNEFNIHRRRNRAVDERDFAEKNLAAARNELLAAEDALELFMLRNRRYENAPQLVFEFGRLQRTVDLRQAVFTSLTQRWEQARLDAVRATPVITILEGPERSAASVLRPVRAVALALLFGGILGLALAFLFEYLDVERARYPEAYAHLQRLRPKWLRSSGPSSDRARSTGTTPHGGT